MKKNKEKRVVFQYVLMLILCFFLVHRAFVKTPGRFEHLLSTVCYPFITLSNWVSRPFVFVCSFWSDKKKLVFDLEQLRLENESLYQQLVELESSKIFLDETRELRNFKQRYDTHEMHLAKVILKHFDNQHFFLIDAGKQKNITKNMAVVYKNCLVGKVTEVYPFYSKVALITDPVCQVASYCVKTKTAGIYQGTKQVDGGSLLHVDHLANIKKGECVVLSGEGLVFLGGFGIGQVQDFKDTGVHYDVTVKFLIDVTKLAYCYVV